MALLSVFGLTAIIAVLYAVSDEQRTKGALLTLWAVTLVWGAWAGVAGVTVP